MTREESYGKVVEFGSGKALASCAFCPWTKETVHDKSSHWHWVDRAAMGLQLHARRKHPERFNARRS